MAAVEYNFEIEQGADFRRTFVRKKRSDGYPVDMTGYTARLQGRESFDSDEVLLELTTENDGIVIGGLDGRVHLVMTAAQTEALSWRRVRYDLELIAPDGFVKRWLFGRIRLSREITRST